MTHREKVLAVAVAASAVLWGGMRGVNRYRIAVDRNEGVASKAAAALDDAEFAVARGEKAKRQLIEWAKRSLPADRDFAKSLYQDWVRKELAAAGLTIESLTDKTLNRRTPHFGELSLEARAGGTLEQLTDFLYKFYAAPHLHRISAATLTPSDNGAKLAVILGVDALILPDSPRTSELASGEEQKLPHTKDEFRTSLTGRNVFVPHTPGADPAATQASGAHVSMIVSDGDGSFHLWIHVDAPEKTHKFKLGDNVEFGSFSGTLIEIDVIHAEFETKDGRVEVRLGQNLGEVKKIEEEVKADAEEGDESAPDKSGSDDTADEETADADTANADTADEETADEKTADDDTANEEKPDDNDAE
jgi:hypothetical protein